MPKVLIIHHSRRGNSKAMTAAIEEGVKSEGLDVQLKDVKDVSLRELLEYEGIIIGSPTYYGTMAGQIKHLIDESVKYHGKFCPVKWAGPSPLRESWAAETRPRSWTS